MAVETHDGSYYRARYYDPSTGRFLSEDPIQFSGGLNFYPYVEDDPINLTDETGMAPSSCKAKKPCFAQLRFRPVESPWEAAASGATHSFWYVQDSNGVQYIVSAGPTGKNSTGTLNVWPPNTNLIHRESVCPSGRGRGYSGPLTTLILSELVRIVLANLVLDFFPHAHG